MNIEKYTTEDEWLNGRLGKITGTTLKDLIKNRNKQLFYKKIAEKIAVEEDINISPIDRGKELEKEAIFLLQKDINKTFNTDLVIWSREDVKEIAISPDGFLDNLKEAVEVKCLNSAEHIQAIIEKRYPPKYHYQVLQYFIVNEKLEKLYFVMFDPRVKIKEYIKFIINREDIQNEINETMEYEIQKIDEINNIVKNLTF